MLTRRRLLSTALPLMAAGFAGLPVRAEPLKARQLSALAADHTPGRFRFEQVIEQARGLAARPFAAPAVNLPPELADLGYDGYRRIRFRPDQAFWADGSSSYRMHLFHRGFLFREPVKINIVDSGAVEAVPFRSDLFDYDGQKLADKLAADGGYAGLRLHYPLNRAKVFDEVIAFQGASYFRAVGRDQVYGLSARALAVDCALPKGEEFPAFREFWVIKPGPTQPVATVLALLDGERMAGAYRFDIVPGDTTEIRVESRLFFRRAVDKLGIAPLTSMFFRGEADPRPADDFRDEVHDSDGLLIESASGERIWRPLRNPRRLAVSGYALPGLRGFGLLQRDRGFHSYEDLEARYEARPSAWIEPLSNWGPGRVELVEIPSEQEVYDNIVAFWVPEKPIAAGSQLDVSYRLSFGGAALDRAPGGYVVASRLTKQPGSDRPRFVIDFAGGKLDRLPEDAAMGLHADARGANVLKAWTQKNQVTGGWRAFLDLAPAGRDPVELRAFLHLGDEALSETWSYQWAA